MKAMSYEYLIRRIYHVEKNGIESANADIYKALEHAQNFHKLEPDNKLALYKYQKECIRVWIFTSGAIKHGIRAYRRVLSPAEIAELKEAIKEPEMITKKDIDRIIDMAERIYLKHEIHPL